MLDKRAGGVYDIHLGCRGVCIVPADPDSFLRGRAFLGRKNPLDAHITNQEIQKVLRATGLLITEFLSSSSGMGLGAWDLCRSWETNSGWSALGDGGSRSEEDEYLEEMPQYLVMEESTSLAHASIPPTRFFTSLNPLERRKEAALALRIPVWQ